MTKPKTPASPPKVIPEADWDVHSPYGALRDPARNPLERLESVHSLLMKRNGIASMDAALMVFGPFLSDSNSELGMKHGADKLRPYLMVLDSADKACSMFPVGDYADRSHLERLAELVPYVPHHRFDRGTPEALLYALGQMAGEVWAPYSGDVDLNDRPCASEAEGYFPTATKARDILGRFAIRHDLAHRLWDWGSVHVTVGVDSGQVAAPSATSKTPAVVNPTPVSDAPAIVQAEFTVSDEFESLCQHRKDKRGDVWTTKEKDVIWVEICKHPNRTPGLRVFLATRLGLESSEALSKLVRDKKRPIKLAEVTAVRDGKRIA